MKPILTEAAIALDPIARLQEAAQNSFYVLQDFPEYLGQDFPESLGNDVRAHWRHHWQVTPLHEAGHSVAAVLAGRELRDVCVYVWPKPDSLGMCRTTGPKRQKWADLLRQIGASGMAREVVSTFAGPVAELRFDPRLVHSGLQRDKQRAEAICKFAEATGIGDRYEWHDTAWQEACRMFQEPQVWAATLEVTERLRQSTARAQLQGRVTGRKVAEIVAKHLPGGWDWQGLFKEPPQPN